MSTTTTGSVVPSGRFFFSNHGLPVAGSAPGDSVGVDAMGKETPRVWYLEAVDATLVYPGKHCYVLRTEKDNYFLAMGGRHQSLPTAPAAPTTLSSHEGPGPVIFSRDATTTADKDNAWWFVLDGEYSNGTFEGKLVSPDTDSDYTLGLWSIGLTFPVGTAFMSLDPKVLCGDQWELQLVVLEEKQQ